MTRKTLAEREPVPGAAMKRRTVIGKVTDKIPNTRDQVDMPGDAPETIARTDEAFGSAADSA